MSPYGKPPVTIQQLTDSQGVATTSQPSEPAAPSLQPWVKLVLSFVVTAGGAVAGVLPSPWGWMLAAVVILSAAVAGLRASVPKFLVGKPLVAVSMVAPLAAVSSQLVVMALAAPEGLVRSLLIVGALVTGGLAGVPVNIPSLTVARR